MDKNHKGERCRLRSGIPCTRHKCIECCIETRMPLSPSDIRRIAKHSHRIEHFAEMTRCEWRLKNKAGRCVFLLENRCRIYSYRPEGCTLYPLVYDENLEKPVIDSLCPYGYEFEVNEGEIEKLGDLLKRLEKESHIS